MAGRKNGSNGDDTDVTMGDVRREIEGLRQDTKTGFGEMKTGFATLGEAVGATKAAVDATKAAVDATKAAVDATRASVDATRASVDATRASVDATRASVEGLREDTKNGFATVTGAIEKIADQMGAMVEEQRQTNTVLKAQQRKLTRVEARMTKIESPKRKA